MNGESKFEMQCAEFEAVLADALDGTLGEAEDKRFQAHLAACTHCAPLFNEAQAGLNWLSALKADEVEPPAAMMENILRATIGTSPIPQAAKPAKPWWERLKENPALAPIFQTVLQPRFAMGFGMAFFSITMLMNLAGVKVTSIRHVDLRPSAMITTYYETTGKIVKYWENIRFVYEIESRVKDLKKATAPKQNEDQQKNEKKKETNKETSGLPQDRKDGRSEGGPILANAAVNPDGGSQGLVSRQRRFL
jgi:hypothetical protein